LYGLRDAAQAFELSTGEVMALMGCEQGRFSPCFYYHKVSIIRTWFHGDDFISLVPRSQAKWFEQEVGRLGWETGSMECSQMIQKSGFSTDW